MNWSKPFVIAITIIILFWAAWTLPLLLANPASDTGTNIVLPDNAMQVIGTSFSTRGMLVTYIIDNGSVHAALYPNPHEGDRPSFIYNFVKERERVR